MKIILFGKKREKTGKIIYLLDNHNTNWEQGCRGAGGGVGGETSEKTGRDGGGEITLILNIYKLDA